MNDTDLIAEARKASRAVYLATDADVADDISRIILGLVAEVSALREVIEKAKADAWDEGYTSTRYVAPVSNPYRAIDPFTDPKPWVTPNGRVAHPLPQTVYRKSPRTREQYEADEASAPPVASPETGEDKK